MVSLDIERTTPEVRGWLFKEVLNFNGGINTEVRPEDLEDNELIQGLNVRLDSNRLLIDEGYRKFTDQEIIGAPRAAFQFFKKNGDQFLVLITDEAFYVDVSGEWRFVVPSTTTTTVGTSGAPSEFVEVVDVSQFAAGDNIGIQLAGGGQHTATVLSIFSNTLTISSPVQQTDGDIIFKALKLSGNSTKSISIDVVAAQDIMIFCNGVDKPHKFNGSAVEELGGLPPTLNSAELVFQFGDYTFLLNTVEDGQAFPQRVRNSNTGDPEDWTTGNAQLYDLTSREDHIKAVARLADRMIVYKERSVIRFEFVGTDDILFDFDEAFTGEGVLSQDAVADLGDYHIFLGVANLYRYNGDFNFEPIGDKIRNRVFGVDGEINPSALETSFLFYVEELDELWIFIPTESSTRPTKFYRYSVSGNSFLERDLNFNVSGFGFNTSFLARRWTDLQGSWTDQNFQWTSQVLQSNSPTTLLLDEAGNVFEYDYFQQTDDGTEISYVIQTKDFRFLDRQGLFTEILMLAKGSNISVEFSIDGGVTWGSWGTVVNSADFNLSRLHRKVTARQIRFRISGSGGGFGIETFAFRYRPTLPVR